MRHLFSSLCSVIFFSVTGFAQTRMICHIATDTLNFNNRLMIANTTETTKSYSLFAFSDDGDPVGVLEDQSIQGGSTHMSHLSDLFSSIPGYLVIEGDPEIVVSIAYSSTATEGTSAFVHESSSFSKAYRFYPGNWQTVFDGLVLVNPGDTSATVILQQKNASGEPLSSSSILVGPGTKEKMVLESSFSSSEETYFEMTSDEPLAMLALSGSKPGESPNYLWQNPLIPFTPGNTMATQLSYALVDTSQVTCFDSIQIISCGNEFAGQDAQYSSHPPQFLDNGDGTVSDLVTGLMWQQDPGNKKTFDEAVAGAASLNLGGYSDWRLPTIKELYSLILFKGIDPSGYSGSDTSGLIPFIDDGVFEFEYGDESQGERIIDSQFATSTTYVSTTMNGDFTDFGVNFADGRIKGYGTGPMPGQTEGKGFFVLYVRGNDDYGQNNFKDNGDGTITDTASGLTWMQLDSGDLGAGENGEGGMTWEQALEWAENLEYAGYTDWRLPDIKELQSIVDYTRSPDTSDSPAIDPLFSVTSIINEGGEQDYPYYWSGTTHQNWTADRPGGFASYVAFGRGLGWMQSPSGEYALLDVHGAGCQRSDPKAGNPEEYPYGHGPQGDVIRIYNHVRCVR